MSIIRFEQINDRGEASRPRVDLIALGALLDRAALGVEMLRLRLRAAGEMPGPEAEDLERASSPRCGRSERFGSVPAGAFPVTAPGDDHDEDHYRDPRRLARAARGPAEDPGHDRRPGGPADRDGAGRPAAWPARRSRPSRKARRGAAMGRYPGDDDRSQASQDDDIDEEDEEDPPKDGRQLLGWCAKQVPDAKGKVIGYGKKRGFPCRVVDWRPDQVEAAYRFARSRQDRARR